MSIREKRGYICVDAYNLSIDLWTTRKNPQGIKIKKKKPTLCAWCIWVSFIFICISEMGEDVEKILRENSLLTVHQEKSKMCWYFSN